MNGAPRKLDVDAREWGIGSFPLSIHPDGRQIAYLSRSLAGEIVVLELSACRQHQEVIETPADDAARLEIFPLGAAWVDPVQALRQE